MESFLAQPTPGSSKLQLAATAIVSGAVVAGAIFGYQSLQLKLQEDNAERDRVKQLKKSISAPRDVIHVSHNGQLVNQTLEIAPSTTHPSTANHNPPSAEDLRAATLARRAQAGFFDDELILEQLARNRVFLGDAGLAALRASFVVVVGCGGVGSHCAAALARSGVSRIRLVDFDQVTLSSLNRHAVATLADVGMPKVQCLKRRLEAVAPWVRFDLRGEMFERGSAERLLGSWDAQEMGGGGDARRPDFVVDAIDNIDTKVDLLKFCVDQGLPVISAMGAGTKSDPTKVVVGDISCSTDDRLSRATRRKLKLKGVTTGIPVVFSTEQMGDGKAALLPLPEEEFLKGSVGDLGVMPDFRVRILPVLGTMPAVFGYTVANHVILKITGYPIEYASGKGREKLYDGIQAFVQGTEEKILRAETGGPTDIAVGLKTPITMGDVAFLVDELYRGRSVVTGIPTKLVLVRWHKPTGSILIRISDGESEQKSSNVRLSDLVCMTKEEAGRHLKEVILGTKTHKDLYDNSVIAEAEARMKEAEKYEKHG